MITELLGRLMLWEINSGACHADWVPEPGGAELISINPATGEPIARVMMASPQVYDQIVDEAAGAFLKWRKVPAPARGEVVRLVGLALRDQKADLGLLDHAGDGQDPVGG